MVAVKVLRPGVERRFKGDLKAFFFAARLAEKFSPEARRLRMVEVVDTLARTVAIEMDLRLEAAAMSEMAENTRDDPDFRVPVVDWNLTGKDVLTLEWIDGTPLSDRAALVAKGFDLPRLGRAVIQTFLRQAMRDGFFHADMHPGNLFVDASGQLVAVDFGIMGRLGHEGTALPGGDPVRLHHARLSAHRAGAFRRRLRAARIIRSTPSRRRSARSASRSTTAPPKTFRWPSS